VNYTQSGKAVGKFTLAVERGYKDQDGQKQVDFIDIATWNNLAEICRDNLSKGRLVAVEGRLQIRSYETDDGSKRKVSEVVADSVKFLDWPKEDNDRDPDDYVDGFGKPIDGNPDDLPF
jgi:single-strand DNA-binding protein